ncbi:glycosyltransferase [Paenibacillus oralis]|uniref:Glycosyltransferase n=1 Tax=Paenibacillus oralis TaxID=2490856 RepID=A0A3P3TWQ8_9BACL|nr:glycosyltransferase [Paenibacillus oralis]RRJ62204.1 glycosyltransferase [Paenibacillus oralis]
MVEPSETLVSVIVPSYNYENYIIPALESIYNQTYQPIELIVIDDNSKDNSCNLIKETIKSKNYIERFRSIKYIQHQYNRGAHNSINEGILSSVGQYVSILNADDLFESNRIEELIKAIINKSSEFVFSKINVIDAFGNDASFSSDLAKNFIKTQESIKEFPSVGWSFIPHNTAISTGNMLFSRKIFDAVKGFRNLKYCHDWDFALRCLLLTEPLFIETTRYYYRLHGNNTFMSLGDVVDKEVKIVLGNYFKQCRKTTINQLAPSPRNWPDIFFDMIKNSSLTNFWYFSKTIANNYLQFKQNRADYKDYKYLNWF